MRDIVTAVAALVAIALIALMVGPFVIDWDSQRGRVAALIRERTGIEARIAGPLQVSLLPTPELDAGGVEFGPEGAPVARAERLTVTLSATALLSGRVTVTSARADNAEIDRSALAALAGEIAARPEAGAGPGFGQIGIERLMLRGLRLVEGAVGARGAPHDVTIEAPSLAGPFRIDVTDPGLGREFHAQIGRLEQGRARIKGLIEDRSLALRAGIDGIVALPGVPGRPLYDGLVTLNGNPILGSGAGAAQVPVQGSLRVIADTHRVSAEPVTLTIGDGERALQLTGRGEADLAAPRPRLSLALATKRLDLTPPPADLPPRARPVDLRAALLALAQGGGRPLPFDLDLALDIGALQAGGAVVHDLAAAISVGSAGPILHRLTARLPGATALRFARTPDATQPLEGELAVESGELGGLIAWLRGADIAAGLPAEGRLAARLAGGAEGIAIQTLTLDSSAGALAGRGDVRPAAAGQSALPRLTLDLAARRFDARVLAALEPLKPVAGLEIATRLAVERLVLDQAELGGLRVALDRSGGTVSLHEFRLTGRAGEVLTLSGTIGPGATHLTAKLDAERLGDLARLAGAVLPRPEIAALQRRAALLEPALAVANIRLTGESGASAWDLAVDGVLGGTRVSARTRSTNRSGDLAVEAEGEIAAPDGARLLAQISGQSGSSGAAAGQGTLRFKAGGDPRREITGSVGGEVAGLGFRFDGGYNPFRANPLEGRLSAETADLRRLLAAFGTSPPVADNVAAEIHGRVFSEGAKITLTRFEARLDAAPASGEISLDFARGGQVAGQVRLTALDLAALFAPASGATPPAFGAGPWSAAPFGPSVPPPLAGDLWIEAESGRFGAVTLEAPQFVYRFAPDLAAIEGFEARMGEARIRGSLTALRKDRNVEIAGRIEAARLPVPFLGGRLSGAMPFSGGGENPRALVASLAGAGEVALDRFLVPEADPAALARIVARDLDELMPIDENRIGALVDRELRRAAFESPAGTWPASLVNGQVRLGGVPLPAAVSGRPEIEITPAIGLDLVRGEVDSRLTFRQLALPKGWRGAVPEIALVLSRRLAADAPPPRRALQVGALVNGLLAMAIQRDLERAEAFEADIRERAMHLRRQKGDAWRERREREIREIEAMMADEARQLRLRTEAAAEFERQRLLRERLEREARERAEREAAERLARQRAEEERARLERLVRDLAQPPAPAAPVPPAASGAPLNLAPPASAAPPG
ncbi:AsmA family protein [Rhabdaerophilum calidifontis]|uniref:AsmA family protein n=1 Tax=Rhabdaerophilum calidifontis TaxID=2604328 RepID=UPI00140774CD|nr:AsmA family protein [Rhabdaerophilum calidifontis]